ncbi:MAG TPA: hypothetical protein VF412_05970 [Bdellovibrio sp.]|uniref:hypothetical protein n=1 Tax=Bdellovibrio sp. TaxID=28201 RepID=UPI002F09428D
MVEIILAVWFTCFVLSMTVVSINFYVTRKQLRSKTLQTLNNNLQKIEMYWSSAASDFAVLSPGVIEQDAKKTLRNTLLVGFLGLASVPGFILLTAVVLSIHYLARPRREIAAFQSALAKNPSLSESDVKTLVHEISEIR